MAGWVVAAIGSSYIDADIFDAVYKGLIGFSGTLLGLETANALELYTRLSYKQRPRIATAFGIAAAIAFGGHTYLTAPDRPQPNQPAIMTADPPFVR